MPRESIEQRRARLMPGARWLRDQRERRGWTGRELAGRLGIAQERVSAYERAQDETPPWVARKLAEAFEMSELDVWRALGYALPAELRNDQALMDTFIHDPELRAILVAKLRSELRRQDGVKPTRRAVKRPDVTRPGESEQSPPKAAGDSA